MIFISIFYSIGFVSYHAIIIMTLLYIIIKADLPTFQMRRWNTILPLSYVDVVCVVQKPREGRRLSVCLSPGWTGSSGSFPEMTGMLVSLKQSQSGNLK